MLTKELWEIVKDDIPSEIGVYVGQTCVKKAKKTNLPDTVQYGIWRSVKGKRIRVEMPLREALLDSMIRSLYRDSDKLLQTYGF